MFVAKDFTRRHLVAQICANSGANTHFGAYLRDEAIPNKILSCAANIGTISRNMPTNFELKRLKPAKLDIVEKPENRVHKLTDSNGALPS